MRTLIVLCLVVAASAAWKDCSGANSHGKITSVEIIPDPPRPNANLTINAAGTLNKDITSGTYDMNIKWLGITILDHLGDACKNEVVQLPLNYGTVYVNGLSCPQRAGVVRLTERAELKATPAGPYTVTIKSSDQDKQETLCVEVTYTI